MPKLGLRELTRARTILDTIPFRPNNGVLLIASSIRSFPNPTSNLNGTQPFRRSFNTTTCNNIHEPEPKSAPSAPGALAEASTTLAAAIMSNEVPATDTGPPLGSIGIVFTDIVKSTNLWEKDPEAMIAAMHVHDEAIRSLTLQNDGYEVKQNGDGFMIAFPTAKSTVQFCLDVQEKLLKEAWSSEILELPPGEEITDEETGRVLFRGLQLRISAHWGEPVSRWNEVIERMDYLGPVVNRAARFVQVTEPGQIVVSEDFLLRLQSEMELNGDTAEDSSDSTSSSPSHVDLKALRSPKVQKQATSQPWRVRELGEYNLQGLDEPQKLWFIVPRSLEARAEHWQQVTHVSGVKGNVK